jgi:molybdate transport system substrate-binding protein
MGAQLERGVPADVVIMNRPGLAELVAQGRIVAGTDRDLAHTVIGVAAREGTPRPDISTAAAFREALLRAKVVAVTPGNSLVGDVLPRLGIANQVTVRIGSRYTESIAIVARGEAGLAFLPVSEILNMPGVEFVGAIPREFHRPVVYAAAVVAGSRERERAQQLIAFLSSDGATEAIRRSEMEPSFRR